MKLAALGLALALAACTAPDQHNPARYGTHTIAFANAFNGDDVAAMSAGAPNVEHLGPGITVVGSYVEDDCHGADYCVHHWDSGAMTPGNCPLGGAARWHVGTGDIDLDPVCITSMLAKQTAFEHEVGHAMGMHHVCEHAGDAPDCDTAVGFGLAVMNPALTRMQDDAMWIEDYSGTVPQVDFTQLDLDEFNRTHP